MYYLNDLTFKIENLQKIKNSYFINGDKINSNSKIIFYCEDCGKETSSLIKTTYVRKYPYKCINCSRVQSTIDKYNVSNISQLDKTQDTIRKNNLEKYGVSNTTQLKEIKDKIVKTSLEKYGVTNGGASKQAQEKIKNKMISKYGCHYLQTREALNLNRKNFYYFKTGYYKNIEGNNIHYRSNEELKFLKACNKYNIVVNEGPRLNYFLDGKEHYYFVDFETSDYLFEIKSSHVWYREALESGEIREKETSAKEYAYLKNKKFMFLIDVKNYNKLLEELLYERQ